jgi:Flp pilus assembly secretin CpaC
MSRVFGHNGRRGRRSAVAAACWLAVVAAGSQVSADTVRPAASADVVTVILDQAQVVKLPERVATLIVGNPLIADVAIQPGNLMVITGKGYGSTNLVALDKAGDMLMQKTIQVQGPRDNLIVVYRGVERESYSCTPNCERRIVLGDSPVYFDSVIGQTGSRTGQALSGGASSK